MYEQFYGLQSRPFSIVPNPDVLYMSPKHRSAFAHLQYGLMEGTGVVVLTGGIGTGKTTLIRFLLSRIHTAMEVAVIFNTNVTGAELLRLIIQDFEIGTPSDDKAANISMLHDFLVGCFSRGRKAIVIIDEAQNLSAEALEEVRLLSNLQGNNEALLQIVLVGQPELRNKLADSRLTQLAQRVTSTFHLEGLTGSETREYIQYRLTQAGGSPELFADAAMEAIQAASLGVPRIINILCNGALVLGFAEEHPVITAEIVAEVVRETGSMMHGGASVPGPAALDGSISFDMNREFSVLSGRVQTLEEKNIAVVADNARLGGELNALRQHVAKLQKFVVDQDKSILERLASLEQHGMFAGDNDLAELRSTTASGDVNLQGASQDHAAASESPGQTPAATSAAVTDEAARPSVRQQPGFWSRVRSALGAKD